MKKKMLAVKLLAFTVTITVFLSGCLKDTATRTYKLYRPVYATTQQVMASVKSDVAKPVSEAGKMVILNNYIYLNEVGKGVHVIDNTNPASPVNKAFIPIPGNEDVAIKDNILYADCYTDLFAIDISNPANAVLKDTIKNIFPERKYINGYIIETGKVVVDWNISDTTFSVDVADGTWMWGGWAFASASSMQSAIGKSSVGVTGSMSRFAVLQNYLYAVTPSTLNAVDIANAAAPQLAGKQSTNAFIETIFPFKDKLFLGSTTGMFIYTTTNPVKPTMTGQFSHARLCDPVIADNNFAYVTLHSNATRCMGTMNQMDVLDIQNISQPKMVKTYALTSPKGLSKDGNTLMICDGNALKIFDATDAANIVLKQTINIAETYDVIAFNGNAYVSAKDGLYQYSYSNYKATFLSKIALQSK